MLASPLYRWIERHPIVSFYTLAFVISWLGMIPMAAYSWGIFPIQSPLFGLLGAGGPTFAALIVAFLLGGKRGVTALFAPLFHAVYNTILPAEPSLLMAGLTWLGVIIIIVLFGPARLSRAKTAQVTRQWRPT